MDALLRACSSKNSLDIMNPNTRSNSKPCLLPKKEENQGKEKEIVVIIVTSDILVICENECDQVAHGDGRENQ